MDGASQTRGDLVSRLLRATAGLRFARTEVAAFYDAWLAARPAPDRPGSMMHAIVATAMSMRAAGQDPPDAAGDGAALALALAALGDEKDMILCLGMAAGGGLFDRSHPDLAPHVARRRIMDRFATELGLRATARAELQAGEFHRLTSPEAIWTDPGHLVPALLMARRRLCVVRTFDENGKRRSIGTGFLIGPSAVLTNHHVVRDLPKHLDYPEDRLELRFDYSPTTGLDDTDSPVHGPLADWCLADSPSGPLGPDGAAGAWWIDRDHREAWRESVAHSLDYAVIRLASAPGHVRGWYDLGETGDTRYNRGCWVLHHPSGAHHTVTEGEVHFARRRVARVFHSASTVKGSSGGLVLDSTGAPIALHYLGLSHMPALADGADIGGYRVPGEVVNCAVALDSIAADLRAKAVFDRLGVSQILAPHRSSLDGVRPVFGRRPLMGELSALDEGARPVLRVHVAESARAIQKPGKSFTIDLIRALFRPPEHHHIVFDAEDIEHDALGQTEAVLRRFAPDLVETLPRVPDTTTPAYIARLVDHLCNAIRDRLGNRTVWLMIDGLDRHDLSDASGREFLGTLYGQARGLRNLRIVLIGLAGDIAIGGLDPDDVISSAISADDIGDAAALFSRWLDERLAGRAALDPVSRNLLSRTVAAYAGDEAPLARMAAFTESYMSDVLGTLLDEAGPRPRGRP